MLVENNRHLFGLPWSHMECENMLPKDHREVLEKLTVQVPSAPLAYLIIETLLVPMYQNVLNFPGGSGLCRPITYSFSFPAQNAIAHAISSFSEAIWS
jgi:hypothetical protein